MSDLCAVSVLINHPMNNFSHSTLRGQRNNSNQKYVLGMSIIYMPAKSKVEISDINIFLTQFVMSTTDYNTNHCLFTCTGLLK